MVFRAFDILFQIESDEGESDIFDEYLFICRVFRPSNISAAGVKMTITEAGDGQFVLISSRSVIPGGQQ